MCQVLELCFANTVFCCRHFDYALFISSAILHNTCSVHKTKFKALIARIQQLRPTTQHLGQLFHPFPPHVFPSPVLHVCVLHHFAHRSEFDTCSLNSDHGCAFGGRVTAGGPGVLLEERHTLDRQPYRTGTVYRRWDTALKCVPERSGTSIKETTAFLNKDLGYDVRRIYLRRLFAPFEIVSLF